MPPTGDFKAQLGRSENPGLLNQEARLAQIRPGRNPYVTGTALPGNSPVFLGAYKFCAKFYRCCAVRISPAA
jgi:hypothetical protein